jgi:hypothetical protein
MASLIQKISELIGGGERVRTDDLLRARQALSQLSYTPISMLVGLVGIEPTTSRLSGVRSSHLSYRPVAYHYGYLQPLKSPIDP